MTLEEDGAAGEASARISRRCLEATPVSSTDGDGIEGRRQRRRPVQTRSRHTVAVILEAAREVFDELGYARATTNRIAERAGVSIGSLYQYFPDKAALLEALGTEHHAEIHEVVGHALEGLADVATPLDEALRGLLDGLIALHEGSPGLHRVLAAEVATAPAAIQRKREEIRFAAIVASLLSTRPDVRVADPVATAHVVVQTIEGVTRWLGHDAPENVDRRAVAAELLAMLVGYLRPAGAVIDQGAATTD